MKSSNMAVLAALGCFVFLPALSQAGTIQIDMSGVNLTYSDPDGDGAGTGSLTDTGAGSDSLTVLTVDDEGTLLGTLTNPPTALAFDLSILSIPSIVLPAVNSSTVVSAPAGGSFELFVSASSALELALDTAQVIYTRIGTSPSDIRIRILFTGSIGDIVGQDLPFGVELRDPVTLSFNVQGSSTTSGGYLTGFVGAGVGTLSAEMIPEPGSIALMGLAGLMSLVVYARRKLG